MRKRLISLLLAIAMIITVLPMMNKTVLAEDITLTFSSENEDDEIDWDDRCADSGWWQIQAAGKGYWVSISNNNNAKQAAGTYTWDDLDHSHCFIMFDNRPHYFTSSEDCTVTVNDDGSVIVSGVFRYDNVKNWAISITYVPVAVESVTVDPSSTTLHIGSSLSLTATVAPSDATDKTVIWSSDDTGVATVDNGVVTAQGSGIANIKATATNGTEDTADDKTATCIVTVPLDVAIGVTEGGSISVSGYHDPIQGKSWFNYSTNAESITLKATAAEDYVFSGWYEGVLVEGHVDGHNAFVTDSDELIIVRDSANKVLEAVFEKEDIWKCAEGNNNVWQKGSTVTLDFTFDNPSHDVQISEFSSLTVDDELVTGLDNFDVDQGSIIIILKPAFLETLSPGEHTLTLKLIDERTVSAKFTVSEKKEEEKKEEEKEEKIEASTAVFKIPETGIE